LVDAFLGQDDDVGSRAFGDRLQERLGGVELGRNPGAADSSAPLRARVLSTVISA